LYPDEFDDAPKPLISGEYRVAWAALVQTEAGPDLREVDRDQFSVP
jgi:hypothetical protein